MTLRKDIKEQLKELDEVLTNSFKEVELDMKELVDLAKTFHNDIEKLNKRVKGLEKDRSRETKVGPRTGKTYMTNTGKINALANFLGVNLEAKPAEKVKASISVSKVKKGKK